MKVPFDDLRTSDIVYLADEYIHHERNRRIFINRFAHGYTIEKLAEIEDMSIAQIRNVLRKTMDAVLKHIDIKDDEIRVVR